MLKYDLGNIHFDFNMNGTFRKKTALFVSCVNFKNVTKYIDFIFAVYIIFFK